MTLPLVAHPDDLSTAWLDAALGWGLVASYTVDRIGTGQVSDSYRVSLSYGEPDKTAPSGEVPSRGAPTSVVLKLPASDPSSRASGASLGLYERECRFYAELAPRIGGPLSACHHATFNAASGDFCLVLEDAAPAVQGDQIAGCSVEHAELAGDGLAALHGPVLHDAGLAQAAADSLGRESPITAPLLAALLEGFAERYAGDVPDEHLEVCRRFVASFDGWAADQLAARQGLVHGDHRLDNLLFGTADAARPLTVVDWQTVTWGAVMTDLAYFLGGSLRVADRRAHEQRLVARYCDALGVDGFTFDEAWEGYRRSAFLGILMAIVSPMLVARTERGDQMFLTVLERHVAQVLDLDCLDLLPPPASPAPLQPEPSDEHRHPATEQPLWNESWYFDFVDVEQRIGGYVRLGLYPNEQNAWYTAVICGPDRPTVSVIDFQAPLPALDLAVRTSSYRATQEAVEPLNDYRVTLEGTADVDDAPAARLAETYDADRRIEVALDLAFLTDGAPYQYRLTPRYEIPCRVSGTLRIGDEIIVLSGVPGQRDHSWGVRDWWSMDWIWNALHFEDDSHVHALELRLPGQPPIGIGYVQQPGADWTVPDLVDTGL